MGATVVVDNTFATPINQNPLALGADLVIHSATKFLGGHADALGGALVGSKELVHDVYHFREINGATLHPEAAYLLLRGMKTLGLRIARQNASALAVARHLADHPAVTAVFYPGLESHPNHDVAERQMRGYGGMLSFQLEGGFEAVKIFLPRLRFAHRAANLGTVETVVAPPATGSHVELTAEERAAMGIPESLVRYSVGIEDVHDLIDDLDQALAHTVERIGAGAAGMTVTRLALIGFGTVGQGFAQILAERGEALAERHGLELSITAVSDFNRGSVYRAKGFDPRELLDAADALEALDADAKGWDAHDHHPGVGCRRRRRAQLHRPEDRRAGADPCARGADARHGRGDHQQGAHRPALRRAAPPRRPSTAPASAWRAR